MGEKARKQNDGNEALEWRRTPIPKAVVIVAFIIATSGANMYTTMFSYTPRLILWFGYPEIKVGYYAGILGSALFMTSTIMSLIWGYLADKYGYKKITLITVSSLSLITLAFSFTVDYTQALVLRLLQGLCYGFMGTIKAIVRQRCDDSNVAFGMSIILAGICMGTMAGPGISGILVFPIEQYPDVFGSNEFLKKFPLVLPYLFCFIVFVISVIGTYFAFPQDQRKSSAEEKEKIALLDDERKNGAMTNTTNESVEHTMASNGKKSKKSRFRQLFSQKFCLLSCVVYWLVSLVDIGFDQLFPLYCANFKKFNGLAYEPKMISLVWLAGAVVVCIAQLTVLPHLMNKVGFKKVCFYGCLVLMYFTPLLPLVRYISNSSAQWFAVLVYFFICRVGIGAAFTSVNMLVNNSVGSDLLGMANGLALLASYSARLISPMTVGSTYSWSLKNIKGISNGAIGFPFNEYFAFFILSFIAFAALICSLKIPPSLGHSYVKNISEESEG